MCLEVKKITKEGKYKETTWNGKKDDSYKISAWQKCGHCAECMNEKANAWLIRNKYEDKAHTQKCFITLTYKKNPRYLIRKDIQDFFKRLRFYLDKQDIKIRYFGCGEYGTKNGRPHYHAIIYGWKPIDTKFKEFSKKECAIYNSELLTKIWGKGITTVQRAESRTIPYMALYNSPNLENRRAVYAKKEELLKLYEKNRTTYFQIKNKLEQTQSKYYEIKEFNFYSKGIGFDEFVKNYNRIKLTWMEYIGDMEIAIHSSWIKQMANQGEQFAIEEMYRRKEIEIIREQKTAERKTEKTIKESQQHIKEVVKKLSQPIENEYF